MSGGFEKMGLIKPVYRGIKKKGFNIPTPIQRKTIPIVQAGSDMLAIGRTGSGKTAAFLIPILNKLQSHNTQVGARAVILSPTRELAYQTYNFAKELKRFTNLRLAVLVGGEGLKEEFDRLAKNPDIIIATPGRLLHYILELDYSLITVEVVVLDEADRLVEMQLMEQVQNILRTMTNEQRQTMCFSATLPDTISSFAKTGLRNPVVVKLDQEHKLPDTLQLQFFYVRNEDKEAALMNLLFSLIGIDQKSALVLVFVATKHHVEYLEFLLMHTKLAVAGLYGEQDWDQRNTTLQNFRQRRTKVLIATDVAARGIDIPILDYVIHFDFPANAKLFIHRSGRVARAGRIGTCYSIVSPTDLPYYFDIVTYIGAGEQVIGSLPEDVIREETIRLKELKETISDVELEKRLKSMKNGTKLYTKTKKPASKASAQRAKQFQATRHPIFKSNDGTLEELYKKIRNFKPTMNALEINARIKGDNELIQKLNSSKQKLQQKTQKKEIEDYEIDENYEIQLPQKTQRKQSQSQQQSKRVKRGQLENFKSQDYVTNESSNTFNNDQEITQLELNLPMDDETGIKKKNKTVWDNKKKRYVSKTKTNLIKQFTKDNKAQKIYKEWAKKTSKRIQRPGEQEKEEYSQRAQGRSQHSNEMKSKEQILKQRKVQQHKRTQNFRKKIQGKKNQSHIRSQNKIEKHKSQPRSRMLIKARK